MFMWTYSNIVWNKKIVGRRAEVHALFGRMGEETREGELTHKPSCLFAAETI
jgi:hypothetical protein